LLNRGVAVSAGEVFETTTGAGRGHIRAALGNPGGRDDMLAGLEQLQEMLAIEPDAEADIV